MTDQTTPGYREPGHSHLQSAPCRPEACTGHPQWSALCSHCGTTKTPGVPCPQINEQEHQDDPERPLCAARDLIVGAAPCALPLGHDEREATPHVDLYGRRWRTGLPTADCNDACAGQPCVHRPPTSQAQADADKVQQRRLSELQAENTALRNRAETAEAALAGVTSALQTLFRAVPQRIALGSTSWRWPQREGVKPVDRWDTCAVKPERLRTALCVASELCEAHEHLLACPKHPNY